MNKKKSLHIHSILARIPTPRRTYFIVIPNYIFFYPYFSLTQHFQRLPITFLMQYEVLDSYWCYDIPVCSLILQLHVSSADAAIHPGRR